MSGTVPSARAGVLLNCLGKGLVKVCRCEPSALKVTDSKIRHAFTSKEVIYIIRCRASRGCYRDEQEEGHEAFVHINKYNSTRKKFCV